MRISTLVTRSLVHHRRVNAAVVAGVAVAVAVLAGALVVGDSVRASLRGLFLKRLGQTHYLVAAPNFFRDQLAEELAGDDGFARAGLSGAVPLVALEGMVTDEESGRRASSVRVYGVDERFWRFHGIEGVEPNADGAHLSPPLAAELGAGRGARLLLRVEKPSEIPVESLHGRREDVGGTLRLVSLGSLEAGRLGEFSLRPTQGAVRAIFVPLEALRRQLRRAGEANAILVGATGEGDETDGGSRSVALREILKRRATNEDRGVRLRALEPQGVVAFETDSGLVNDETAAAAREAAQRAGLAAAPVLSYLANSLRIGQSEVPYSLVTAIDEEAFDRLGRAGPAQVSSNAESAAPEPSEPADASAPGDASGPADTASLILNEWAARDLGAKVGDAVTLDYYLWEEGGRLLTRSVEFKLAAVVPIAGLAADRELVPDYPGITGAESVANWDPPFPVDLSRIRPRDEAYWDEYRATPKAFVPLGRAQQLWASRFGALTSLRLVPPPGVSPAEALARFAGEFAAVSDLSASGFEVVPVRAEGLAASRGATDFGEYFLYFSFFLVVSALLLAALFFRLGVEQRVREIGVLRAVGFSEAQVRRIFLAEGLTLAAAGSLLGLLGAWAYAGLVMRGLRTWWVGAVSTTALELHLSAGSLAAGAAGGVVAALVCVVLTLRGLRRASVRSLLHGGALAERGRAAVPGPRGDSSGRRTPIAGLTAGRVGWAVAAAGGLLLAAAGAGLLGQAAGFFGGGTLLLIALLCWQSMWLRGRGAVGVRGRGAAAVARLGLRSAAHRPGRSVLCITLIAAASFIIVAVDSFRREGGSDPGGPKTGTGGYALMAETLLPVVHDPNSAEGREALNLPSADADGADTLGSAKLARFRLRPGDDASCLNLYRPRQPRVLGATADFLREGRFRFARTTAATEEEEENPWLLLDREFEDGAVPVLADANSLAYVLHLKVGEEFTLERGGAAPARLRVVGALVDSIFQGELLMSERSFTRLFPEQEGYRLFLIDVPEGANGREAAALLEGALEDYGFDAQPTAERLAEFHRVENTYLSTFQMLGGLGLALGTLGLGAVLLRNVLERRRELALLRAIGYGRGHFALMILAENALLLLCGVLTGTLAALVAIAPAVAERGGHAPVFALGLLLLTVVAAGLAASLLATLAALRSPLIPALRSE
jgi:ABC-type lipoprotein release transport system permease subunit